MPLKLQFICAVKPNGGLVYCWFQAFVGHRLAKHDTNMALGGSFNGIFTYFMAKFIIYIYIYTETKEDRAGVAMIST